MGSLLAEARNHRPWVTCFAAAKPLGPAPIMAIRATLSLSASAIGGLCMEEGFEI